MKGRRRLDDSSANHENFIEMFLLLSNYNENLAKHVRSVTEKSEFAFEEKVRK